MTNEKQGEDLGIHIATKEEAAWIKIKDHAEEEIAANRRIIVLDKAIIRKANQMIRKERRRK